MKIGIALGSGGIKGAAHLGVLEVLEKEHIAIDAIAGSSIGAVMGAMYAFRPKVTPSITQFKNYLVSELYDTTKLDYFKKTEATQKSLYDKLKVRFAQGAMVAASLTRPALFNEDVLRKNIQYLIPPVNIEDSLIPLCIVAADVDSGEEVVLHKGPLVDAVMSSSCIPGVFSPVNINERRLVDGGIVNPVPCNHVRELGADFVIGVDLTPFPDPYITMDNSFDSAMRAADISRIHIKKHVFQQADIQIRVDATDIFWADFSKFEHCIDLGRQAAQKALPEIKKAIEFLQTDQESSK